jgi:murein DD-endopeptidase MepM/ murein hydrolase activator NlpD
LISVTTPETRQITRTPDATLTPAPPLAVERFFQLDPAIADYLDNSAPIYGVAPLDPLAPNIPRIGAYLPRSGDVLDLIATAPTALPTLLPYPTSPPLPIPPPPTNIPLPTIVPADEGMTRTLPYALPPNSECAPAGLPVDGILSQRYHLYHSGIDLALPLGSPVIATHSGDVTYAGWSEIGYGYLVILQSGVFITYYAHNTSFNVIQGQQIGRGSILAWSGSTGNSTGPHVHYETRINDIPVDPLTFDARGYAGC